MIDPSPSRGRGQRARWTRVSRALAGDDAKARIDALVEDAGHRSIDLDTLVIRAGIPDASQALAALTHNKGPLIEVGDQRYVGRYFIEELSRQAIAAVDAHHAENPLQPGLGWAHVIGSLPPLTHPLVAQCVVETALAQGTLRVADAQGSLARPGK